MVQNYIKSMIFSPLGEDFVDSFDEMLQILTDMYQLSPSVLYY